MRRGTALALLGTAAIGALLWRASRERGSAQAVKVFALVPSIQDRVEAAMRPSQWRAHPHVRKSLTPEGAARLRAAWGQEVGA